MKIGYVLALLLPLVCCDGEITTPAEETSSFDFGDVKTHPLIYGQGNLVLERYRQRVKILHNLLRSECPNVDASRVRREIISEEDNTKLKVEKILYEKMTSLLIECKREKCQTAINLTESWRNYGNRVSGANCDKDDIDGHDKPWFRFAEEAGNMMLDSCPIPNNCGTRAGMWTNDSMPSAVGVVTSATAYASVEGNCARWTVGLRVMRCSLANPHDFVYKVVNLIPQCDLSFCGMSKQ